MTSGQGTDVMAAFTADEPDWTPTNQGLKKPKNTIELPPGATEYGLYTHLYLILVAYNRRLWKRPNGTLNGSPIYTKATPETPISFPPAGVPFLGDDPYFVQVYKLTIDKNTGDMDIKEHLVAPATTYAIESQSSLDKFGGALGSLFDYYFTVGSAGQKDHEFGFNYSVSGGWDSKGIVVLKGAGVYNRGTPVEAYTGDTRTGPAEFDQNSKITIKQAVYEIENNPSPPPPKIRVLDIHKHYATDDERNADKSMPTVGFWAKSVLAE